MGVKKKREESDRGLFSYWLVQAMSRIPHRFFLVIRQPETIPFRFKARRSLRQRFRFNQCLLEQRDKRGEKEGR